MYLLLRFLLAASLSVSSWGPYERQEADGTWIGTTPDRTVWFRGTDSWVRAQTGPISATLPTTFSVTTSVTLNGEGRQDDEYTVTVCQTSTGRWWRGWTFPSDQGWQTERTSGSGCYM